jgi:hypothetical protein
MMLASMWKRLTERPDDTFAPELDDPEHVDGEPELTDEDLAGRLEDSEPLAAHVNLRDDDAFA